LRGLVDLREVNLSSTFVTSAGMEHCVAVVTLQNLYLGNTQVDDDGMQYMGQMKRLRELILPKRIADKGVEHLSGLRLRVLYLRYTQITPKTPWTRTVPCTARTNYGLPGIETGSALTARATMFPLPAVPEIVTVRFSPGTRSK
jgi:hypothetical protein